MRTQALSRATLPLALAIACALVPVDSAGVISEPDHVVFGLPTVFGEAPPDGSVITLRLAGGGIDVARYVIGSRPDLGELFELRVPMDSVDPRRSGTARAGEPATIRIDGQLAGDLDVGERGTVRHLDVDPENFTGQPVLSIGDVEVDEGDSGSVVAVFELALSRASEQPVQTAWRTVDGTASAAAGDYQSASGQVTIAPGFKRARVEVYVLGDTESEGREQFAVRLEDPAGAIVTQPDGTCVIRADDAQHTLAIDDANASELPGDRGEAVFDVRIDGPAPLPALEVSYRTMDATAIAGEDYQSTSGQLTIGTDSDCRPRGDCRLSVRVPIFSDTIDEDEETFTVELFDPVGIVLGRSVAQGTILADGEYLQFIERHKSPETAGLLGASGVAMSPQGDHAYAVSKRDGALVVFDRNATNGELTATAVYHNGDPPAETNDCDGDGESDPAGNSVTGLLGARGVAVSPDGQSVYVAGFADDAVAVFSRCGAGSDSPLAFLEAHFDGQGEVEGLDGATSVAVSPDGAHVYVAGFGSDGIAIFERATDGSLAFVNRVRDGDGPVDGLVGASAVAVSPTDPGSAADSQPSHVYAVSALDGALITFARQVSTGRLSYIGTLSDGVAGIDGLGGAAAVALSPDGGQVYVAAGLDNAIAVFTRDPVSGTLVPLEVIVDGSGGVSGLRGVDGLAIDPAGTMLYTASQTDSAIGVFRRDPETGRLSFVEARRDGELDDDGPPDEHGEHRLDGLAGGAAVAVAPEPDLGHVYYAGSVDHAVAAFVHDDAAPTKPSVASTTHQAGTWSRLADVDLEWQASDTGGSGLDGYAQLVDELPDTDPVVVVVVAPAQLVDGLQTATLGPLSDGDSHYFHVRACDRSDNCGEIAHFGPLWIDATPPEGPGGLRSTTHTAASTGDSQIGMLWDAATDATSGLAGYSGVFDPNATLACNEIPNLAAAAFTAVSPALPNGNWYFHLCAVDHAGNWTQTTSAGPFFVGYSARAGGDRVVGLGEPIVLGEVPTAVGGTPPYQYSWRVEPAAEAGLSSTDEANPVFVGYQLGVYEVEVIVTDTTGAVENSRGSVHVVCNGPVEIYNQIFFDGQLRVAPEIFAEDVEIVAPADVWFSAGRVISIGNGFSVGNGASFTAVIDPSLDCAVPE